MPRLLKTSHVSKSHDSLHLPRNQSMPKTAAIYRACHKVCTSTSNCSDFPRMSLNHQNTRCPLHLTRKVITKSKTRPHLRQAPSRGQLFAQPCAEKLHLEISEQNFCASRHGQNARTRVFTPTVSSKELWMRQGHQHFDVSLTFVDIELLQ